ncbi:MAG: NAD+ synthase [Candidatus Omnitrophica bacterium]|nr:NAD+ synthase [Candidatus Omnitrophota bacterium]
MKAIRLAIAQINTIVGDLAGNTEKILFCLNEAMQKDVDLIAFPELTITGYPPEDLLLKPHFINENIRCLNALTKATKGIIAIVGFVNRDRAGIYNSAAILSDKKVLCVYDKMHLPNYGVFDEKRYFRPGKKGRVFKARGFSFAVNICEDVWISKGTALKGADFLINLSASPYCLGKIEERQDVLGRKARTFKIPIVYCNLVGGQDELVFDGRSAVFDKSGAVSREAKAFEEDLLIVDFPIGPKKKIKKLSRAEEVYSALTLGVSDYVRKNNFKKAAVGLSGGIDSALVASLAVDALGKANVLAVSMPSRYSSKGAQDDAQKIAKNLGIRFTKVPIDGIFEVYISALSAHFAGMEPDITEENVQARIRGNILMAFSNKFSCLVLNTGNKSETSVGYCTLYGDMAGGFAVIKDVPKNLVYELARFVNSKKGTQIIPQSVLDRAPSAELSPGQKDQDSLPPYDLLDEIIDLYIGKNKGFGDIVKKVGHKDTVKKVLRMIDVNEYKRRQAPPGIKITPRSFGKDRRMPITNKFQEVGYARDNK